MKQSFKVKKLIVICLSIFLVIGLISILGLTIYSMFTPETFTLVYIVLVLFTGTSTIGFYSGSKHLIGVMKEKISGNNILFRDPNWVKQNESLIKEIKKEDESLEKRLKRILSLLILTMLLLILVNLLSILHNANILDQFFGYDDVEFRVRSFTGHLILEIGYFVVLLFYLFDDI